MKFEKLIRSLITNRKITLFFVALLITAGALSYIAMPKQETPDFSVPYAMITTVFPGAPQTDVDAYVTLPIDTAMQAVDGYRTSLAYSSDNLSLVIVELQYSADKDAAFRQMREALRSLQQDLPEACGQIQINTNVTDTAGVLISLSSDTLTNEQITAQAQAVEQKLRTIEGFRRFTVYGVLEQEAQVRVNQARMQAAGLSLEQIVSLIAAGGVDLPMGRLQGDDQQISVDFIGGYTDINAVASLPVGYSAQLGRVVQLQDIADITLRTADRNTLYTHNGAPAVIVAGYFENDINVLPLKAEISDALDAMADSFPDGLEVSLILSQPQEISQSLMSFLRNLLVSVGLVLLVVLLGMGLKNALVVSVSLPLSVLLSFAAMNIFGIKIHQISIAALVLSLGMLVDNSIVVSDAMQRNIDEGMDTLTACIQGIRSVALPILTSTLTTVAAFAPFIFLNSIAGDYIKSLPQIVCIALLASYISAVFVIPVLGYLVFKPSRQKTARRRRIVFSALLNAGMRHRFLVVAIMVALLAGSGFLALQLDTIFFPASDKDILYIDIRNQVSGDRDSTRDMVESLSDALQNEPGIVELSTASGGGVPRFNDIMYVYTQTPDIGQIMLRVDLKKAGFKSNADYAAYLQSVADGLQLRAKIVVKELMYGFPMDEDLKIRVAGSDLDALKTYEGAIYDILTGMDGLLNENRGNSVYTNRYAMTIDGSRALGSGVMPAQMQNELSIAMLGREAANLQTGEPIVVTGGVDTIDALQGVALRTGDGRYVGAGDIMQLTESQALSTIPRVDGEYAMTVTADYDLAYPKEETLQTVKAQIEALDLGGAAVTYDGEDAKIKENFGQVGVLGLLSLAVVFVILLLQFQSFRVPLVIFITIPLAAIGSVAGLYLTGLPLSFTALLGVVSLMGIVVNNAIILLDTIRQQTGEGVALHAACVAASRRRLRPILLSSITTVIGLIPLAIGNSQLFKPMAVALMSGLLVSALLTLIVLPVFVSLSKSFARHDSGPLV